MNEHVNEFTKELDNYNSIYIGRNCGGNCYILKEKMTNDSGDGYVFRVPGATRGMIYVDENDTITNVVFCKRTCFEDDIGCFVGKEKEVMDIAKKYTGQRLEFK